MADQKVHEIATKTVLYTLPGMDSVEARAGVEYHRTSDGPLTMDLYYPPRGGRTRSSDPTPSLAAVIFVTGYPDPGTRRMLGCAAREMGSYVSWARLVAASGLVAIAYENQQPSDVAHLFEHVHKEAAALGVDATRVGVWSCSGSGPMALSMLMSDGPHAPTCGALVYPYTIDLGTSTLTAAAAKQWGFTNACAGKSIDDLPNDRPLFVARAGRDQMPGLNATLDPFVGAALGRNVPITVANHATGPHAFDLFDDSDATRHVVEQILAFLRFQLRQR